MTAFSGSQSCAGPGVDPAFPAGDPICVDLVRTLSERVGVAAALTTVVVVLMMVGVSRLMSGPEGRVRERALREL
jgi:hypothetical protein